MVLGDLFHLPVQLHLLHAATARGAPLLVRATICTSIVSILAFQLAFAKQARRVTKRPLRDAAALLTRPWLWATYANHLLMCLLATCFNRGFGMLTFCMGLCVAAAFLTQRVRATHMRPAARINGRIAEASFGMELGPYTRMSLLSALPHTLLRCAYPSMYVAIFGCVAGGAWRLSAELALGFVATIFYFAKGGWWYYTWHRALHDDPVLYRAIHAWHHLYRPSTALSSGTETCLEYTAHQCNPFTMSVWHLVTVQLSDPSDIETHNTASYVLSGASDGPRGEPYDWHLKHHLTPASNYGIGIDQQWDDAGGSASLTEDTDLAYVSRVTARPLDAPSEPLEAVSLYAQQVDHDKPAGDPTAGSIAISMPRALAPAGMWVGALVARAIGLL